VAVETRDIVACYGKGPDILKGVSVKFFENEIACIIGPNGAGKSTLFRAMFGTKARIRKGSVLLYGEDITNLRPEEVLRKGISYVPQGRANFPTMTVRENLEMGAFIRKDGNVEKDIQEVMERFPVLREKQNENVGNLSGGQQQILEMGRALLLHPRVIFLDEPSLGLAPQIVKDVFDAIQRLIEEGLTIVLVEQNAKRALEASDHAIVLELGKKRFEGTAVAIRSNERVKKMYLGG
jgi:branched-chain amino acid transport system ATP-binding protein